ncbi:MAG: hypothetical protein R2761_21535 [Acidimicrobiales bacterium]
MSEKIPARFRKTKTDKWAVMAPVADLEKALAEGGKIEVQKKSGDWSTFTVGSLGRPFDVDGVSMCYGYAPGDGEPGAEGAPTAGAAAQPAAPGARPAGGQGGGQRGRSEGGARRPARGSAAPPPRDDSEPLPVYQGGAEDEWGGEF